MFIELSFIAAFLGGLLTLLPSCGPFILPAFFALAFKEKDRLVLMTLVLFLGFLTTFIPLGLGLTVLIHFFIRNIILIHTVSGVFLIALGLMAFFGIQLPFARYTGLVPKKHDIVSVYLFGMVFGIATGSCTAPTIGAVLTVVIAQGVGLQSILLLATFALGMVLPLIILAIFFDRIPENKKQWFFRKVFTFKLFGKKQKIPLANMLSAMLFILMGITFLFTRIQNALARFFDMTGTTDVLISLYQKGLTLTANITPLGQLVFFSVLVILIGAFIIKRKS